MAWLAGVDGCKMGWFRICRNSATGELAFDVIDTAKTLVATHPAPKIVALDIPIGVPAAGRRTCDVEARVHLGSRRSSVFPAPIRRALLAASREEASEITSRADGRRVSAQAFALFPKIRSVDDALQSCRAARQAIREVHPEICFWAWNGRRPMRWPKKTPEGRAERLALAEAWLGKGILARARGGHRRSGLGDDDIADAIAALWTAHRIEAGTAETLPETPPCDETGIPMEIAF